VITEFRAADQDVRDAIRDRIDESMCVEAGAGTGKTTVLVERIVRLLGSGRADVRHIAVITFTERAAAELAARVRERLELARDVASEGSPEQSRLTAALRDLSRAHMETIHAFASGLLRERPVEAGIDPGFRVLDDLPSQLEFEAAWSEWTLEQMAQSPPPTALISALNLGLDYAKVREAADLLQQHRDVLPLPELDARDGDVPGFLRELDDACMRLEPLLMRIVNEEDGAYTQALDVLEMRRLCRSLAGHEDSLHRAIAQAQSIRTKGAGSGSQGNWRTQQDCRDVKALLGAYGEALAACGSQLKQAATARLLFWLQDFVRLYEERRKAAGVADFDDLLIWARNLVRDNAEVRAYFQHQFTHILVDEFQDTDPLQAELIVWLSDDHSGANDWRRARPRPGSLFVVGDPKQSIYRFRRADIAMYDDVKRDVFGGEVQAITQNFRSAGPIIDWVNEMFGAMIVESPGVQPPYRGLHCDPRHPAERGDAVNIVRCVVPPASKSNATAGEVREAEANAVASIIRSAVDDGAWTLRDGRAAGYRDVAVLVPSRAEIERYEYALARAGVPYRHEGGRTFFVRQEVRELIALLRAIDDPADAVATVAALRSSAFGLSDEDLLLHRASGGVLNYLRIRKDATGAVAGALHVLRGLAEKRHTHILPDIVRAVLDETRLVEVAMLQPQGEQSAANLLKLVDQARAFSAAGGGALRAFVRWLREHTSRAPDETEATISEETDDVVRVLTVHASKGLEFPVVVFANMGTNRADRTRVIPDRARRTVHLRLGKNEDGFVTPDWEAALQAEQRHDIAEQQRLLYVAATRAEDRLVVPVFVASANPPQDPKSYNDQLRLAGVEREPGLVDGGAIAAPVAELPVWRRAMDCAEPGDVATVAAARDAWLRKRDADIVAASRPLDVRTASALKGALDEERATAGEGVWRGRATEFGTAVHALLERIDLSRPEGAAGLATTVAAEYGLRAREREIAEVARRAIASPVIARALASPRLLREVEFAAPLPAEAGGGLAEGRIDLLFAEDGELVVADFKTDRVTAAGVDARAAEYRPQALIYAWAAAHATGMPVREVIFLFARPGIEHVMTVGEAFRAEAESLLSAPAPS
jgi:ATP-dependent helicase/nuclease subunit A